MKRREPQPTPDSTPSITNDDDVVKRILASSLFDRSKQQRTIFEFLWLKAQRAAEAGKSEVAIASYEEIAAALRTKLGSSQIEANAISGALARMRRALRSYFEDYEPEARLVVSIPPGMYALNFTPLPSHLPKQMSKVFWAPYLGPLPVVIIYPEPIFFEDPEKKLWVRDRSRNDETDAPPPLKEYTLTLGRHYMGIGDSKAILNLAKWFLRHDTNTDEKAGHGFTGIQPVYDDNIIAIGNVRTMPWVFKELEFLIQADSTLRGTGFRLNAFDIENLDCRDEEKKSITTKAGRTIYQDGTPNDSPRTVFGVFYRIRHPNHDRFFSVIAAQNGMAANGISKVLTSDEKLADVFRKMEQQVIPKTFQILFACQLDRLGNLIGTAEHVTHRPKPWMQEDR